MIYKLQNGGVIKLQKAWTKIPRVLRKAIKGFGETVDKATFVPAKVKYYGPTMGKTTSIRTNPNLVDFDAIMRDPSKALLKKYGFSSKYQMFESGNQDVIKEYQDLLVQKMNEFKSNPNNSGKVLVVSQSPVVNPEDTGFQFDNEPSIPSKETFVSRNVGRGGTTFDSEDWWTNLMQRNPNLKINNRFVSDIEGSKELIHVPKITIPDVRTYHLVDSSMPLSRPISEAEILGIPKGERFNLRALENPQYWGYQQWNQRYNAAIESGNLKEAQKLRDLHFKIKAPDTKVVDENGMPLHTYHGLLDHTRPEEVEKFTKFEGVNWDLEHAVNGGSKVNHWKLSVPNWTVMRSYHTPDYYTALHYAREDPNMIYTDYLNIKNPFTWNEDDLHNILLKSGHKSEKIPYIEHGWWKHKYAKTVNGVFIRDANGRPILISSEWIPEKHTFRYPSISDWSYFAGDSKLELMKLGYDGLYIPQYYNSYGAFVSPSQFKSAEPITRTDTGEIIPIVKRDNFHNLDRRYKQGGILKTQK